MPRTPVAHPREISFRELKILTLLAEGYGDEEIAKELRVDFRAVRRHQTRLMKKLKVPDMDVVMAWALEKGLIDPYSILNARFSKRISD